MSEYDALTLTRRELADYKWRVTVPRRVARLRHKEKRRAHRRCFWTRPWGHVWEPGSPGRRYQDYECLVCEKGKVRALAG